MEETEALVTMLDVISHSFVSVDRETWESDVQYGSWAKSLNSCRITMTPLDDRTCILENWLSVPEVHALQDPPSFEEKSHFAARHFVGGLPESAVPVESLYRPWSSYPDFPSANLRGMYDGDSAQYMKSLIKRMGMQLPSKFKSYPDHLSLEADMASVLLASGGEEEGREFLGERFSWLSDYRAKLLALGEDAYFYLALVDMLSAISLRWDNDASDDESDDESNDAEGSEREMRTRTAS